MVHWDHNIALYVSNVFFCLVFLSIIEVNSLFCRLCICVHKTGSYAMRMRVRTAADYITNEQRATHASKSACTIQFAWLTVPA